MKDERCHFHTFFLNYSSRLDQLSLLCWSAVSGKRTHQLYMNSNSKPHNAEGMFCPPFEAENSMTRPINSLAGQISRYHPEPHVGKVNQTCTCPSGGLLTVLLNLCPPIEWQIGSWIIRSMPTAQRDENQRSNVMHSLIRPNSIQIYAPSTVKAKICSVQGQQNSPPITFTIIIGWRVCRLFWVGGFFHQIDARNM